MSSRFDELLAQFRLVDAIAVATGERFNMFEVLGLYKDEKKTSAFLAALLNSRGTHTRGATFLEFFVEMLRREFACQFDWELSRDDCAGFEVTTEDSRGDGSIDIFLENRIIEKCFIIENKIQACDQDRQLGRYYDYAIKKFKRKNNIAVIYLTLYGDEPSDYALYGKKPDNHISRHNITECKSECKKIHKEQVLCVSYKDHISKWLDDCLKEVIRIGPIRESLLQYQSWLKSKTGQPMAQEFSMNANEIFSRPENRQIIPSLLSEIKFFLRRTFWMELKDKIKDIGVAEQNAIRYIEWSGVDRGWRFINETNFDSKIVLPDQCGVAFLVEKVDEKHDIYFSVQDEGSINKKVFCSFPVVKSDGTFIRDCDALNKIRSCRGLLSRVKNLSCDWAPFEDEKNDRWFPLGYQYVQVCDSSVPLHLEGKYFECMVHESKQKSIVVEFANEIKKLVIAFKKTKP